MWVEVSEGTLLGGRVKYAQPVTGWRTGIEPVLLAASIPAQPGERVLEAGTGAGAGLLCLGARIPGLTGVGIEREPEMAALARRNMADNGLAFTIMEADVSAAHEAGLFDHVFANPPWHDPASTRPSDRLRDVATHRGTGGIFEWIDALDRALAPGGTLTLILPAAVSSEVFGRLWRHNNFRRVTQFPLWRRVGSTAKMVLIRATHEKGSDRPLSDGLVLHGEGNGYTPETEAILRGGAGLAL